jgi:tRNA threonylcarbamoyladenosine biosynthesis protein TsaB
MSIQAAPLPHRPLPDRPLLGLDTGSPVVGVAVTAADGTLLAERSIAQKGSSQVLLQLVAEALEEAGTSLPELAGVVALQGPGSFTGLRIGLATVQGLSQALALPAAAVPTLHALAFHAGQSGSRGKILALVDALRGDWFVQPFDLASPGPTALSEPQRRPATELEGLRVEIGATATWGFGADHEPTGSDSSPDSRTAALAAAGIRLALLLPEAWDPSRLTRPLYLRAPAVTLPKGKKPPPISSRSAE